MFVDPHSGHCNIGLPSFHTPLCNAQILLLFHQLLQLKNVLCAFAAFSIFGVVALNAGVFFHHDTGEIVGGFDQCGS